jgi:hypothetical protein
VVSSRERISGGSELAVLLGGVVNTLSSIDQLIGRPSYKVSSFKVPLIMLFRGAFLFIHSTRMFFSRELKRMSLKLCLPSAYK